MTAILTNAITSQTDYTAQWFTYAGVSQGNAQTMTEGLAGTYTANPPSGMVEGQYLLEIRKATVLEGQTSYNWNGTTEVTVFSFVEV